MTTKSGWFEVDKEGLAQVVRRKGLPFILYELVQNAWDTKATYVRIQIAPIPGRAAVSFSVYDDDPDGFKNLTHAYTLYAPSEKKSDATLRGRFNLGEKLVLAACNSATITSTSGTVTFEKVGKHFTRKESRQGSDIGSLFEAVIPMTRVEMAEVIEAANLLLPPIQTTLEGRDIPMREPLCQLEATLPTEMSDAEGFLRKTSRKTAVRVYEPLNGTAYIYEMGIPVVEVDLPWSVEVMQKIPLNMDRDNVTPAYRRALSVVVLNAMHQQLTEESASNPLVQEALTSPDICADAVCTILTQQYGSQRTVFDPSDLEANHSAVAKGFNVISGGSYNKAQWESIRRAGAVMPSGKLFPTPKPYSPDGEPARLLPQDQWSPGMKQVVAYSEALATKLLDTTIQVRMENEHQQPYLANYGHRTLTFNVPRLGERWFDLEGNLQEINDLLLHEFGHHFELSHLSEKYHEALTRLGASLTTLALQDPDFFQQR